MKTEEQIKQSAEAYADSMKEIRGELEWCATRDDFIAGAHSRDEEIRQLHDVINDYSETIDKLRNPWISVEEQLPKPSKMPFHYHRQVLVTRKGIDTAFMANFCEDGKWYTLDGVLTEIVAPDYWMPIPQLKKGE